MVWQKEMVWYKIDGRNCLIQKRWKRWFGKDEVEDIVWQRRDVKQWLVQKIWKLVADKEEMKEMLL